MSILQEKVHAVNFRSASDGGLLGQLRGLSSSAVGLFNLE